LEEEKEADAFSKIDILRMDTSGMGIEKESLQGRADRYLFENYVTGYAYGAIY
jgi:hypothetical protein